MWEIVITQIPPVFRRLWKQAEPQTSYYDYYIKADVLIFLVELVKSRALGPKNSSTRTETIFGKPTSLVISFYFVFTKIILLQVFLKHQTYQVHTCFNSTVHSWLNI